MVGPLEAGSTLTGVSCVSRSFCMAVGGSGGFEPGEYAAPLIEQWSGNGWASAEPQEFSGRGNALEGVSCASRTFCVAVGRARPGYAPEALIEAWNGHGWSTIAAPSSATYKSPLRAVSCPVVGTCMAVGGDEEVLLQMRGGAWTLSTSTAPANVVLAGVSCVALGRCAAVGDETALRPAHGHSYVTRYSHDNWFPVSSETGGESGESQLSGVSCLWFGLCAAVGGEERGPEERYFEPLVEYGFN
jgi:hypothetical protein